MTDGKDVSKPASPWLGKRRLITALLAAVLLVGGYAALAYTAARSLPGWVASFGVEFEASDWDVHLFSASAVARDVKLRRDKSSEPVLTAAEVEFGGSLWSIVSSIWRQRGAYNDIAIKHGEVLVERTLTGDYNWGEFLRAMPEPRREAAMAGLYSLDAVRFDDIRVVYLEHVPGASGGGVIRTSQARVIFDDLKGSILDLRAPENPGDRPTKFNVKARLADGFVELNGDAGMFPEQMLRANGPAATVLKASSTDGPRGQPADSGPSFLMKIYVENLAVGAYGQMVSTTELVPTSGTLAGNVELQSAGREVTCHCNLVMQDVGFAPNRQLVATKARYDGLDRSLAGYRRSGPFNVCDSDTGRTPPNGHDAGLVRVADGSASQMMASFNAQATDKAPANVRAAAARDQSTFGGITSALFQDMTRESPNDGGFARTLKRTIKGVIGK